MSVEYLHLVPGSTLPEYPAKLPSAVVVIIEADVTYEWRDEVSRWLVDNGCYYMMAWGQDCALWDDSVDYAILEDFNYDDIPEDRYVWTTWHDDESLEEVLWFAQHCVRHDVHEITNLIIMDISKNARRENILKQYSDAYDLASRKPE